MCTQALLAHPTVPPLLHVLTADAEHAQRMAAFSTAFIISRMKISWIWRHYGTALQPPLTDCSLRKVYIPLPVHMNILGQYSAPNLHAQWSDSPASSPQHRMNNVHRKKIKFIPTVVIYHSLCPSSQTKTIVLDETVNAK